jgi:hypothetical protein
MGLEFRAASSALEINGCRAPPRGAIVVEGQLMDRDLWWPQISQNSDKAFPCPRCALGQIRLVKDSVKSIRPSHNLNVTKEPDFEPDWIFHRFGGHFQCDQSLCGEIVVFSGHSEYVQIEDEEFGWGLEEAIHIDSFSPAPPILRVPGETPKEINRHLVISYELFWIDFSSCVARVRAGIEEMLNERGIPATSIKANGTHARLTLGKRIDLFKVNDPDNSGYLDALRFLGNIGAHEVSIDRDKVMDAYELLETVLQEVYGQRTAKLKALRDKIVSTAGKY